MEIYQDGDNIVIVRDESGGIAGVSTINESEKTHSIGYRDADELRALPRLMVIPVDQVGTLLAAQQSGIDMVKALYEFMMGVAPLMEYLKTGEIHIPDELVKLALVSYQQMKATIIPQSP